MVTTEAPAWEKIIGEWQACESGLREALSTFPAWPTTAPPLADVLRSSISHDNKLWLVLRCIDAATLRAWALDCAEAATRHCRDADVQAHCLGAIAELRAGVVPASNISAACWDLRCYDVAAAASYAAATYAAERAWQVECLLSYLGLADFPGFPEGTYQ